MDAKFGNPLQLYKRPRYGPRGQALARHNAMRLPSLLARSNAASTIQRAFGKWKARRSVRNRTASVGTLLTQKTREGVELQEGANSLTRCNFGKHKSYLPKAVMDTLAPQVSVENGAGDITTTAGIQGVTSFAYASSAGMFAYLASVNDQLVMHSIKAELLFTNSSSSNSAITIYDIVARKDAGNANVALPSLAWQYGVDQAGGAANDYLVVGSEPTESVAFNQFYKIVQRKRINMAPGQLHRHEVYYQPNKLLKGQYLTQQPYNVTGVTVYTMIVHHGMPAHDRVTGTNVTIDISSIDWCQKVSYQWRILEDASTSWRKTNNLPTSFPNGEEFVNEAVGQTQNATAGLVPTQLHA